MQSKIKQLTLILMFTMVFTTITPQRTYGNALLSQNNINVPSSWAKAEIDKANKINLIPERIQKEYRKNITREEFIELIMNLYESIGGKTVSVKEKKPFTDTENPSVIIANELGIVEGKGNGTFAPNENITREQVSVIMYRTLQIAKPRYRYSGVQEHRFKDYNMISTWAKKAVGYLYGVEVINGSDNNEFHPKGYSSREEAIVIAKRLYDKVLAADRDSKNGLTVSRNGTGSRRDNLKLKLRDLIVKELGKPYKWGAAGPNSFDCSGLTYYLFGKMGITIPRTSRDQIKAGTYVAKKDLEYGDLVLFARDGKNINHVGIYVGSGQFVHSPESGDVVKITTLTSGYYARSYYSARRVLPE